MKKQQLIICLLLLVLASCRPAGEEAADEPAEIILMTHDSFAVSEAIIDQFEAEHNATVILLPSGDTGAALNQAILSKENPLADVFFGVDNTFFSRALEADIFEAYDSPLLSEIPVELQLDDSSRLLPVDYGDVCLNYDRVWFEEQALAPPQSLTDLADPAYQGLTVVQNPATSSPGLAFLLATIDAFGTEGDYTYLDYWADLRANELLVTDGWEDAYWGQFSAASDGNRPIVVSYASSPPAEIFYADPPIEEAPTAAVTTAGSCFRQVEFVGILKGSEQPELARALVDFMLSRPFQEDIPLNMFVFPANENAALPELFTEWASIPAEPAVLAPDAIDSGREEWLEAWTEVVLR